MTTSTDTRALRGVSSDSLRKTIADSESEVAALLDQLGEAVATGDRITPQQIRVRLEELRRSKC